MNYLKEIFDGSEVDKLEITNKILEASDPTVTAKLSKQIYVTIDKAFGKVDVKEIYKSQGNFRKYDSYVSIKECVKSIGKYIDSFGEGTDKYDTLLREFKFLETNTPALSGAFKRNNNFVKYLYVTAVVSVTELCNIFISAILGKISRDASIDSQIDMVPEYKAKFEDVNNIFGEDNSKALRDIITAKETIIKEDNDCFVLESSLMFFIDQIAKGSSMLLYSILTFVRKGIYAYFFYNAKVKDGIDRIEKFSQYSTTQNSDKSVQLERELSTDKSYAIKSLNSEADGEKEIKKQIIKTSTILL